MKLSYSSKENEYEHLRRGVGLTNWQDLSKVQLIGEGALEAVNRLVALDASQIPLGGLAFTHILNPDGSAFSDTYIWRREEGYLLISRGPAPLEVFEHISAFGKLPRLEDAIDVTEKKALFGVDGPFAWELLKEIVGRKIVGLRNLEAMAAQTRAGVPFDILRADTIGEFGYLVVCPLEFRDTMWRSLTEAGRDFDVVECGLDAIELCKLENEVANLQREGLRTTNGLALNPTGPGEGAPTDNPGTPAVGDCFTNGLKKNLIGLYFDDPGEIPVRKGAFVEHHKKPIGEITFADYSYSLGHEIAIASVNDDIAYAGWPCEVRTGRGLRTARTVSAPVIDNKSAEVRPLEDSFFTVDWSCSLSAVTETCPI